MLENGEAAVGVLVDGVGDEQVATCATMRTADAAAQLIELRKSESIGAIDEHGVGVGHVQSGFDDHRRDEYVDLAVDEGAHHFLQVSLPHLSMAHTNTRARDDSPDMFRHTIDRFHSIVDEEHLAAAIELARNTFVDQSVVPRLDIREHRRSIARSCLHQRHIPQTGQRKVQRTGNRCGSQSQDISIQSKLLEAFLVFDTEAVLLVNDDESELGEGDVVAEQAVRADYNISSPRFEIGDDGLLFFRGLKAAEGLHIDRKISESLTESARMLIGKNGRGHQHYHLST